MSAAIRRGVQAARALNREHVIVLDEQDDRYGGWGSKTSLIRTR